MTTVGEAFVAIKPDTSGFAKETEKGVSDGLKQTEKTVSESTKRMSQSVQEVGRAIATAFVTKKVFDFAESTIVAADEANKADMRIKQIAKSMDLFGGNVDQVTKRLIDYASKTQYQVGIDDEIIKSTQAKLLTFKNLASTADQMGGAFDRATMAAIDMAAAGFGEVTSNATVLGKALENPIQGMQSLRRLGIIFTDDQKKVIASFMETNEVANAQSYILNLLEQRYGGTAAATATASDKLKVAWGELKESIGRTLLPAFESLTAGLMPIFGAFNAIPSSLRGFITTVGMSTAATSLLARNLENLGISAGLAKASMGILNVAMIAFSLFAQQNADNTRNWQNAMTQLSGATDLQIGKWLEAIRVMGELRDKSPAQVFTEIANASIGTAQRLVDLGEAQSKLGISTYEAQQIIDKQAASVRQQQSDMQRGSEITDGASAATDQFASSQEDLALSTSDANAALDAQAQKLQAVLTATLASFSSQLNYDQSVRSTADAIGAFNQLQTELTTGSYKGSDAFRDLAEKSDAVYEAALRQAAGAAQLAIDTASATGAEVSASQQAAIHREELLKVANSLDPNSPLRKRLLEYVKQLDDIPNAVRTDVTAAINVSINSIAQQLGVSPSAVTADIAERVLSRRAMGGMITSPEIALIGEAGPEVVIPLSRPQRAMDLMRESGLDAMVASRRAGHTVNIENAVFHNGTDADLVAQKVNAAEKARSFST